jgi:glycosyltransferase involved in cell wall biosynthesis
VRLVTDPLTFDLVVATVGRRTELAELLDSLDAQSFRDFRVVVADQNDDDGVLELVAGRSFPVQRIDAQRGLSRARNAALDIVAGDVVAFPDDDCRYPPTLLESVADRLRRHPAWGGVTGRLVDSNGVPHPGSWDSDGGLLDLRNVWFRGTSCTIFLRTELVRRIGAFDLRLGLGSGEQSSSGEETDYLVRALKAGAILGYDPSLAIEHDLSDYDDTALAAIGLRDGASLGYILRKHGFPRTEVVRRLVRPAGGSMLSLLRGDVRHARFHAATLRGRVAGYRRAPARPQE